MRYRLAAIGRLRAGFYRDGCDHYLTRLQALAPCEVLELREGRGTESAVKRAEGVALLGVSDGHTVALDEAGLAHSSRGLAERISALELRGVSRVTLLIGGAEGHDERLLSSVDESWSLSPLTLPHDLARLVLLEQLYRVESIRAGHPYHRD